MKNTSKWIKLTYNEHALSKAWMDKNLGRQDQAKFIREAVEHKIKNHKKVK